MAMAVVYKRRLACWDSDSTHVSTQALSAASSLVETSSSADRSQSSGFESPVPRWSSNTTSRSSCTRSKANAALGYASVAACPGPPARKNSGSGCGFRVTAGTTAMLRSIARPAPAKRSSYTRSRPQRASRLLRRSGDKRTQSSSEIVAPPVGPVSSSGSPPQAPRSRLTAAQARSAVLVPQPARSRREVRCIGRILPRFGTSHPLYARQPARVAAPRSTASTPSAGRSAPRGAPASGR